MTTLTLDPAQGAFNPVYSLPLGARVHCPNYGGELVVVGRNFPPEVTSAQLMRGDRVRASEICLSADGRGWIDQMHDPERHGRETQPAVYVARYSTRSLGMHGWVDPVSRRLVQVG